MQARGAGTGGLLETRLQVSRWKTDSVNSPQGSFFKKKKEKKKKKKTKHFLLPSMHDF